MLGLKGLIQLTEEASYRLLKSPLMMHQFKPLQNVVLCWRYLKINVQFDVLT